MGPSALAVDAGGNVYAAGGGSVLRITPAGSASLLAGSATEDGDVNGTGSAARFSGINGIAVGADGHLYVTDGNNRQIRRITTAGVVTTVSGGPGVALYDYPGAIAAASSGELVIGNVATVVRLSSAFVASTLTGRASPPGFAGAIGLDNAGNAYMVTNNSIQRITPAGATSTFATVPTSTGLRSLAVDSAGQLMVADTFRVWRISSAGVVALLAGGAGGYVDATGTAAGFGQIGGLAVDAGGNVFVSERFSNTIRRITTAGVVSTYAGGIDQGGSNDGNLTSARFNSPWGLAFDATGNLWVADAGNLTIRRITPAGAVATVAGTANVLGNSDGTGPAASFRSLQQLAVEPGGSVLVGDGSTLRRVTAGRRRHHRARCTRRVRRAARRFAAPQPRDGPGGATQRAGGAGQRGRGASGIAALSAGPPSERGLPPRQGRAQPQRAGRVHQAARQAARSVGDEADHSRPDDLAGGEHDGEGADASRPLRGR